MRQALAARGRGANSACKCRGIARYSAHNRRRPNMTESLQDIAIRMVAEGKGILAADESSGTIKKRFDTIGLESSEDARRDYREMLFSAADGMRNHISGVILYDETIRQKAKNGTPLPELIKAAG